MSDAHFRNLSQQGYKTAPVMRTILSDYDTPLSVYHKVAAQPQTYLLESVQVEISGVATRLSGCRAASD